MFVVEKSETDKFIELEKLKEEIKRFIIKNKVKKFEVYISKDTLIPTEIEIEIRI